MIDPRWTPGPPGGDPPGMEVVHSVTLVHSSHPVPDDSRRPPAHPMSTLAPLLPTPSAGPTSPSEPAGDPLHQMVTLMHRLLEDPEADAVWVLQLRQLSESLPDGPTRGALESSMATLARLRSWLNQLQARQRAATRFAEVTARLSRVEGLSALMQALADEARQMLDAPLARLDVFPLLVTAGGDDSLRAHSGAFISRLPQYRLRAQDGWLTHLMDRGAPLIAVDGVGEELRRAAPDFDALIRAEGIQGLLGVPLQIDGQCCGLLLVGDRTARTWSVTEVDAVQQLALVAVRAIGRVARADMAQHTLQALHERQRALRLQLDRGGALAALGASGDPSTEHPDLAGLMAYIPAALRMAFVEQRIGPLRRADQTRGTALVCTLLTYIDQGHNARAAARVLGVHVNTLHNRLETIAALLPGWSEAGRSIEVHLALRLESDTAAAAAAYPRSN